MLTLVTTGMLALSLAACGSQLDPDEVARAGGSDSSSQQGSEPGTDPGTGVDPGTGSLPGVDPGTGSGVDPGTSSDPGTGTDPGTSSDPGTGTDPGSSNDGNSNGGDNSNNGGNQAAPPVTTKAGSCEGFKNTTGITDDSIIIGNSSDISGPVPGLFATAQDAVKAYVAYFNAAVPDGICGRHLVLKTYDSKTDAAADQQAYTAACNEVFAMVGSQSAFDSGGASTTEKCGLPDLRASAVTQDRTQCGTCYGVQATNNSFFERAVPNYVKSFGPSVYQHAGYLYTQAGAAAENAKTQVRAMEKDGLKFSQVLGIGTSEFNYVPYAQKLKDSGVQVVFFTSAFQFSIRLRQAMKQIGYSPKLYLRDPTDYNADFVSQGGSDVDGTTVFTNFTPFEEAGSNKEIATYLAWLHQVNPSAKPAFFGVFGWSAARLFTELATQLGGKLSRATLLNATKGVKNWTGNGAHAPQPVGSRGTGDCWRFIQLSGGKWKPVGGTKYHCDGLTSTK